MVAAAVDRVAVAVDVVVAAGMVVMAGMGVIFLHTLPRPRNAKSLRNSEGGGS